MARVAIANGVVARGGSTSLLVQIACNYVFVATLFSSSQQTA